MSLYFALQTVDNNKSKKSIKFQGDILIFYNFIQAFVFTTNHHLKILRTACFLAFDGHVRCVVQSRRKITAK